MCCFLLLRGSKRVRSCISTAESIADSMMLVHPLGGAAAWDPLCHRDPGAQALSPRCSPGPKAETWLEAGTWGSCACLCSHLASAQQGDFGNQPQAVFHQPFPGRWTGNCVLGVRRPPPPCPIPQAGPAPPHRFPTSLFLMLPQDRSAGESGTIPGKLLQRFAILRKAFVNTNLDPFCCNLRLLSFVLTTADTACLL